MAEQQYSLMAFQVAENVEPIVRTGHYDAATKVWVGDTVGAQDITTTGSRSSTTAYTGGAGGSDTESDNDDTND